MTPMTLARSLLEIVSPEPGEAVRAPQWRFRVAAEEAARVEISFDGGDWRQCLPEDGEWVCGWSGYGPGLHSVCARARDVAGRIVALESRGVVVELEDAAEAPLPTWRSALCGGLR